MSQSGPDELNLYTYRARVTRVIDGDSVRADIDLGFDTWLMGVSVRLAGIDTAELRDKDPEKQKRALAAKSRLLDLTLNRDVLLCSWKDEREKFGRVLASIVVDGQNVADVLLAEGLAVAYGGGPRAA